MGFAIATGTYNAVRRGLGGDIDRARLALAALCPLEQSKQHAHGQHHAACRAMATPRAPRMGHPRSLELTPSACAFLPAPKRVRPTRQVHVHWADTEALIAAKPCRARGRRVRMCAPPA